MVYYCCFSLGVNLEFLDFLQKSFIISATGIAALKSCKYLKMSNIFYTHTCLG